MKITIITGGIDSGKTSWCMKNIVDSSEGDLDGVLSVKIVIEGERIGYNIRRIKTGEEVPLARIHEKARDIWPIANGNRGKNLNLTKFGIFTFSLNAFDIAKSWFPDIGRVNVNSILIDELGYLELKGLGFHDLVKGILNKKELFNNIYLVVRKALVEKVCLFFNIRDYVLIDVEQEKIDLK